MTASRREVPGVSGMVEYLVNGYWADQGEPAHAFALGRSGVLTVNLTGLTNTGRDLARAALEAWETVADITFREVKGGAQITFDDRSAGAFSTENYSKTGVTQSAAINVAASWFERNGDEVGDYAFRTFIHEIGHALGLGHPGDYDAGDVSFAQGNRFKAESWQTTVMSYFSQDENPGVDASGAIPVTLMQADILAIQRLYGARVGGPTAGDTVYGVDTDLKTYLGDYMREHYVTGVPLPTATTFTIWDEGGIDKIDLSHHRKDQDVTLADGGISDVMGLIGNMVIATGTLIENFVAGLGDDTVLGNGADNLIEGRTGDDQLLGGGGSDILLGGTGADRLTGHAGRDTLAGGEGDDRMTGGEAADTFVFDGGRDVITDFGRFDTLIFDPVLLGGRGVTAEQALDEARVTGGNVVFDFGRDGRLVLEDLTSLTGLLDRIEIL